MGGGTKPCAILMIGARQNKELLYTRTEAALKYDGCSKVETSDPEVSYEGRPKSVLGPSPFPFKK